MCENSKSCSTSYLVTYLADILWQCIDRGTNHPGHGHGILGIRQAGLVHHCYSHYPLHHSRTYLPTQALPLLHHAVVNHTRLDDINQVYDGQAGLVGLKKINCTSWPD